MSERFSFTHRRLDNAACPPDVDRVYFYDDAEPGLCLLATAKGAKSFYLLKKINGRTERIRLGGFPEISVDAARQAAKVKKGDIAKGINPAEQRRSVAAEMTLDELFKRYLEGHAKAKKRSWEQDQKQYDRYLSGWKNRRLSAIRWDDVNTLHASLGKDHPYAANRLLALLSKLFNYAARLGYKGANPARGVERFPEESRERFIQPDEMARFFKALDSEPEKIMADFFRVLLFTGARRSNVQSMQWSEVNFGRRTWTIPGEKFKNGKACTVHITDQAMEALQRRWAERIEGNPHVFPSYGAEGHIVEPKMAWARILDSAKIDDLRIHDLRRTLGAFQAAANVSSTIIGKSLGHKAGSPATAVYARLNLAPVAAAVDLAAKAMLEAAAPKKPAKKQNRKKTA